MGAPCHSRCGGGFHRAKRDVIVALPSQALSEFLALRAGYAFGIARGRHVKHTREKGIQRHFLCMASLPRDCSISGVEFCIAPLLHDTFGGPTAAGSWSRLPRPLRRQTWPPAGTYGACSPEVHAIH